MKVLFENGKGDTYEVDTVEQRLTQEEAVELTHNLSDTLVKVGIDMVDAIDTLKLLGEVIKESVKADKVK